MTDDPVDAGSGEKKMKTALKIGTHSGGFHCDEILACFMLTRLPQYKDADIVRSRDAGELAKCDVVVDVGGVYDHESHRYDHHQRSFSESMHSLCPAKKWITKLSSAGLVYCHFGHDVIAELTGRPADDRVVDKLYDKVYENFVEEVDGIDNGIDACPEKPRYAITTNLSSRVHHFYPNWNEPDKNTNEYFDKQFSVAMDYVGSEFLDRISYYSKVWWPARELVEHAHSQRFHVDASGEIMVLSGAGCPWKDHLLELEEELQSNGPLVKYVLFEDSTASWRVQCVPTSKNSFENRRSLPESWRGLRDEALSTKSGIEDCVFVHASGFIGGNRTYKGALLMAQRALHD